MINASIRNVRADRMARLFLLPIALFCASQSTQGIAQEVDQKALEALRNAIKVPETDDAALKTAIEARLSYQQALRCAVHYSLRSELAGEEDAVAAFIYEAKIKGWSVLAMTRNSGTEESMKADVNKALEAMVAEIAPEGDVNAGVLKKDADNCAALEEANQKEFDLAVDA